MRTSRFAFLFLLIASPAPAQYYQTDFPADEFRERHAKLFAQIGANAVAVIQGMAQTEGFTLPRQHNTFYYLSGIETPSAYLLLDGRTKKVTIYLPARNPRLEAAEGRVLSAEDADLVRRISGADDVKPLSELAAGNWPMVPTGQQPQAGGGRGGQPAVAIYAEFNPAENQGQSRGELASAETARANDFWDGGVSRQRRFVELLRARQPRADVRNLNPILDELRSLKSTREIGMIRRASQLAGLGLMEAMRSTEAGVSEYQLDAAARYVFLVNDARLEGYRSITASGTENIGNMHYFRNTSALKDGDLVLMDFAPDYRYYTSDIGRVWPVNGKYTAAQRELLQFVLEFHKAVLSRIRPGVTATQVHDEAKVAMEPVFARMKFSKPVYEAAARQLVERGGGVFSHTVGMAVHDVGGYRNGPLKPGQVFSVDPAIRVPEEGLYLRYEDTVVVTENGVENFTDFMPMELDDMEKLVREQGVVQKVPPIPATAIKRSAPALAGAAGIEQHAIPVKVADRVPAQARPFRLDEVRLLDGPFRAAMLRDQEYLLSLEPGRLLHTFRLNAGLPSAATPLGGWEAPDVELRGHTMGHYLSALAIMYASTGDARYKSRAELIVGELSTIQGAAAKKFHPGYLSAFPEELFDRVDARQRVWAPYYTIHKIMAGLLDVHQLCGNEQALAVLRKQADWVKFRVDRLSPEQQQRALQTEFGGMNEVLANLYAVTGEAEYLRVAKTFDHKVIFEPLARGEDPLNRLHANTQIPKIIGAAREYELTGEPRYRDIATFFWDRVVKHRSYVNGGHSDGESFFPPEEFSRHLGTSSAETCNTYNMLKLTRHLFFWQPSAEHMDYYERALFNHILPSQDPKTGMMTYYCPLRPGAFKTYSTPNNSFWCCVGTGLENHGKYNDSIYFQGDGTLYVNLFIPSELTWKGKGLKVRQETAFPESDKTTLTITAERPVRLALNVRYPLWATRASIAVNGKTEAAPGRPGSYLTLEREWKTGDTVQVTLPMTLRAEAMPDNPRMVAFMYGPLVLAARLSTLGLTEAVQYGPSAPPMSRVPAIEVPTIVSEDVGGVIQKIAPVSGKPLTFTAPARPDVVTLVPFSTIFAERYNVYWTIHTPAEWATSRKETAAAAARRQEIEKRSIDRVDVNSDESEKAHGYQGENTRDGQMDGRRWREAREGWFSYRLTIDPDKPVIIVATFRGSEGRRREFDLMVEGKTIATERLEYHPTEFLDREYKVPEELTKGKRTVTVKFQPAPGASTGALFELRVVQ